ncbi:hypothetical protein MNEG_15881 [Monoraphidium neglectum]|uniref:Uncharacterized protein n=1 Tax=Monoraphidium neglectum TaxID=145388 RepID=A0A0D2IVY3_9CHLO|nr:hypothetical protein MNEG_15881 [Monoraphidium neglectum]KIY92082.1 hypothetical protein MNEG_15881 [Monoraphidium neglectum]|eukprot:XP_013891102.1 hypothetical protein MNEG_15881 [Monoraphidium neglectum]
MAGGGGSVPPSPRVALPSGARTPNNGSRTPPPAFGAPSPAPLLAAGGSLQHQGSFFGSLSIQNSLVVQLGANGAAGAPPSVPPSPGMPPRGGAAAAFSEHRHPSAARLCELVSNPMARCDAPASLDLQAASRELHAAAAAVASSIPSAGPLSSSGLLTPGGSGAFGGLAPPRLASAGPASGAATPRAGGLQPLSLGVGGMSRYGSFDYSHTFSHPQLASGGSATHLGAAGGGGAFGGAPGGANAAGGHVSPLLARDSEAIAQRMVHAFPWNKTGQAHLALALRRREAYLPSGAATLRLQCSWGGPHLTDWSCSDAALSARRSAARRKRRRAGLMTVLSRALAAGVASTSAFIALAELALDASDAAAALDAAKRGIKFVFDRSRAGQERARHAALMLNLLAAQAMSRCGQLEDATKVFGRLAARVSEGEVAFGNAAAPARAGA